MALFGRKITEGCIRYVVRLYGGKKGNRFRHTADAGNGPESGKRKALFRDAADRGLTCRENSYSEGNSCATAPTASSATFMQSASDRDTIRGVRQAQSPASVISLHPASSSSNSDCK